MDMRIDDLVAVARDDHRWRLDLGVVRCGAKSIAIEPGDISGVVAEGRWPQHQRDRRGGEIILRRLVG